MSKYHLKIISNNLKIDKILGEFFRENSFIALNTKMFSITAVVCTIFSTCVNFKRKNTFNFTETWYYVLIFIADWAILKFVIELQLNIENFRRLIKKIKNMSETHSKNDIDKIVKVFLKINENYILSKYITCFQVNMIFL